MNFFSIANIVTIYFTTATLIVSIHGVQAMVSPAVTCCEDNGGTYQIVNASDGQLGICSKDGIHTKDITFMEENCPSPTASPSTESSQKARYAVYAVNNCDAEVRADFVLKRSAHGGTRTSHVEVKEGECSYVGPTDQETVHYTSEGSYVSGGNDSCKIIGDSQNSDCKLLGIATNACVINLCAKQYN